MNLREENTNGWAEGQNRKLKETRKDRENGNRIKSHKDTIDFCNWSIQEGKSVYHTMGKIVNTME